MIALRAAGCALLLATLFAPAALAGPSISIDFDRFPGADGVLGTADDILPTCVPSPPIDVCESLGSQYSALGLTFTRGTLLRGDFFPGTAPSNHFVSASPPDAVLSIPVTGISITSYSVWTAVLYALDESDNVLASDTLVPTGGGFFLGTLRVSTTTPIRRFTVLAAGCEIGKPCNQILNLDDLVLLGPPPPVPTLSLPMMAVLGLILASTALLVIRKL